MSIQCGICSTQTKPREKVSRIVVETREKTYPYRSDANSFVRSEKVGDIYLQGKKEKSNDPGGKGWEIVREVIVCSSCATEDPFPTPQIN